jgi:hypothetical protein
MNNNRDKVNPDKSRNPNSPDPDGPVPSIAEYEIELIARTSDPIAIIKLTTMISGIEGAANMFASVSNEQKTMTLTEKILSCFNQGTVEEENEVYSSPEFILALMSLLRTGTQFFLNDTVRKARRARREQEQKPKGPARP